jgi:thiol-disulfide isomerase/thioredoxin
LAKLDGTKFQLSSMAGKVVILDFWASWCGPCRMSLPMVKKIADDFANEPVEFLAINLGEENQVVRGMAASLGIAEHAASDAKEITKSSYQISALPTTILIDRQGVIREVFVGANEETIKRMRIRISELLEPGGK